MAEYVVVLRKLAEHCNFGGTLDENRSYGTGWCVSHCQPYSSETFAYQTQTDFHKSDNFAQAMKLAKDSIINC